MLEGKNGWSYVAGFFDGEGCIYMRKIKKPYVNLTPIAQVSQGIKQGEAIYKIKDFLGREGIPSALQIKIKSNMLCLIIRGGREGTLKFLEKISPYSIVKKEKIKEVIEFLQKSRIYPSVFTKYFGKVVAGRSHYQQLKLQ